MQTEASQHSRSASGFESLDGLESKKGEEIKEIVAFNTKAASKSASAAVTVSTVSKLSRDQFCGSVDYRPRLLQGNDLAHDRR